MVKIKYKFERGRVYLEVGVLGSKHYYWFPKAGLHKRFHPRQIFYRPIYHKAYKDNLIPHYVKAEGWIEEELDDKIVREKLGIKILTETELYE